MKKLTFPVASPDRDMGENIHAPNYRGAAPGLDPGPHPLSMYRAFPPLRFPSITQTKGI